MRGANAYEDAMMDAPTVRRPTCVVCGRPAGEQHHVVPRSHTSRDDRGPTLSLCGFGNTSGCHGAAHAHRLHFRYRDGRWEYLRTPCPVKYGRALAMDGWSAIRKG